jgi:hypothetical protein
MKNDPQLPPPPIAYRVMHAMMWPLLKMLGVSCKDTYQLCSEQMDRKLTPAESFRLRFHLMMCGACRHLPAQFSGLRKLVRSSCDHEHEHEHEHEESLGEQLSPESKERMLEHLKNEHV